jgi:hypothetical protein
VLGQRLQKELIAEVVTIEINEIQGLHEHTPSVNERDENRGGSRDGRSADGLV